MYTVDKLFEGIYAVTTKIYKFLDAVKKGWLLEGARHLNHT